MAQPLTAATVITRLLDALGVPERSNTVDHIVAGDPDAPISGVTCTMMATLDVLRRAAALGPVLVISHEPLYFSHAEDLTGQLAEDPVYQAKRDLIQAHRLVVWHLHDHLHDHRPDLVDLGTARLLGWPLPKTTDEPPFVAELAPTTLGELAAQVAAGLGATAARYIGEGSWPVRRVGLNLGFCGFERNRAALVRHDVDALLVGEIHEWETGEYAVDLAASGTPKGLVVAGHVPSEQAGMREIARLVEELSLGLPTSFLPTSDLYRTVAPDPRS